VTGSHRPPSSPSRSSLRSLLPALLILATSWSALLLASPAFAQQVDTLPPHDGTFNWDDAKRALYANVNFRDAIDPKTRSKLTQGLPTEILFTALVYVADSTVPISTTYQTCRVTWHVWEEMYRVDVTRTNDPKPQRHWTPTINGVLRRCAQTNQLLIADAAQLSPGKAVHLKATVRINPISEELLAKLKRWVSRPAQTATAAPGSALFSTFTGLFMQRIGDAERTVEFGTRSSLPL